MSDVLEIMKQTNGTDRSEEIKTTAKAKKSRCTVENPNTAKFGCLAKRKVRSVGGLFCLRAHDCWPSDGGRVLVDLGA